MQKRDGAKMSGTAVVEKAENQIAPKRRDALRVGICGIGRAGLGMIQREAMGLPAIKIVAGFDVIEERAQALAAICSSRAYSDFEQFLADKEVELVVIATRSHEHVPMAIAAMKAGKDVLVEKPMALDVAGADKVIAASKKLKRRLFVRQNRRFDAPFIQAMETIKSGKIGKLFAVHLRQGAYQRRADWQTLKKFGGGQLLNWGPHMVDWGLQLIGGTASDVWADLKLIAAAGDAEDYVKLLLRGKTGITADIEINGAAAFPQIPWLLMGSCGSMTIDSKYQCRVRYFKPTKLSKVKASGETPRGRGGSNFSGAEEIQWIEEEFPCPAWDGGAFWNALYRAMRDKADFPITLEQAQETMRVITLARRGTKF
jgi:scyllo-inositol 2-dehydrogenase (NADP+)